MRSIRKIEPSESALYLERLEELIRENIVLPAHALEHYCQQFSEKDVFDLSDKWLFLVAVNREGRFEGLILGSPQEGGVATIVWLLVDKTSQGTGLGKNLFEHACKHYLERGAHKIKLTTSEKQTTHFYEKLGMRQEGYHQNHWWRCDFWAMGLDL